MMENKKSAFGRWPTQFRAFLRSRFDLNADNDTQAEVVDRISRGVEFKGTNLWVLIFATFVASLGLNVNSTAVIIGAMLISPLMGPIMGIGLSLGTYDFELLKRSLRNFLLMVVVSILASTVYFILSPLSNAQSELLARTSPTTYDVLIAFFGGLAGMVAQSRKDRASTVISGVAIATALMPPLCTAGFGLATGQFKYFLGAAYLFLINTVFIALAAYIIVRFLHYEKKALLDGVKQKRLRNTTWAVVIMTVVPSFILSVGIIRRTTFETNADSYVGKEFQYEKTMVVDYDKSYHYQRGRNRIELRLVGEPLTENVIDNVRAKMEHYGLSPEKTDLVVKQIEGTTQVDVSRLQKGYAEIIDEKNSRIAQLEQKLSDVNYADTMSMSDLSRELGLVVDNLSQVAIMRQVNYDTSGRAVDTVLLCRIRKTDLSHELDTARIERWLRIRTKNNNIEIIAE